MARGLYGATDAEYRDFGGLVEDVDATELGGDRASAALNVDFDGETIRKRLGKAKYNPAVFDPSLDGPVVGLHAYYPKDGSARLLLAANRTGMYVDAGDSFATKIGDIGTTEPLDILGFRDRVYYGAPHTALQVWFGSGMAEAVEAPIAPTLSDPTTTERVIEDFADATDWTSTAPGELDASNLTTGGTPVMVMTASSGAAVGAWIEALWSVGATVDLSQHNEIKFTWISGYQNAQFQFGVKKNDGTIVWLDLFAVEKAGAWTEQAINLGPIDPADRTASTGLAIAFVQPLSGAGYPQSIVFQSAFLTAGFEADTYRYYATWYNEDRLYESAPSPVASIRLAPGHKTASIEVLVPYDLDPTISHVRLYRRRDDAPYAKPRLVVELPNDSVLPVYSDTRTDAELLLENAAEWTTQYQINPPIADTYALVGNRLYAGAVSIDSEYKPWAFYLSRWGFPHAFSTSQNPTDPLDAGWVELPERDNILRILDVDGNAVIFCERTIWTFTGTGWDDFKLEKRADVGLSARWAVAVYGRVILFLAADGLRALDLAFGNTPRFSSWVVSEPVANRLRAIPAAYRKNACLGIDERERLHLSYTSPGSTVNDAALILDLRVPGALTNKQDPTRPGWTAYSGWGFTCFETLKRGGGDNGELLGGDTAGGTVWRLHRSAAGADLEADDGTAIPWSWTGPALDVGRGQASTVVYVAGEFDPAAGKTVTLGAVLDRGRETQAVTLSLGSAVTGVVGLLKRIAGRARYVQLQVSGSHSVLMRLRSGAVGFWPPKVK